MSGCMSRKRALLGSGMQCPFVIEALEERVHLYSSTYQPPIMAGFTNPVTVAGFKKSDGEQPTAWDSSSNPSIVSHTDRVNFYRALPATSTLAQNLYATGGVVHTGTSYAVKFDQALFDYMFSNNQSYLFTQHDLNQYISSVRASSFSSSGRVAAVQDTADAIHGTSTYHKYGSQGRVQVDGTFIDWAQPVFLNSDNTINKNKSASDVTDLSRLGFSFLVTDALSYRLTTNSTSATNYAADIGNMMRSWAWENPPMDTSELSKLEKTSSWNYSATTDPNAVAYFAPNWFVEGTAGRLPNLLTAYNILLDAPDSKSSFFQGTNDRLELHTLFLMEIFNHANLLARTLGLQQLSDAKPAVGLNKALKATVGLASFDMSFSGVFAAVTSGGDSSTDESTWSWNKLARERFQKTDQMNYKWDWKTEGIDKDLAGSALKDLPPSTNTKFWGDAGDHADGYPNYDPNASLDGFQVEQSEGYSVAALSEVLDLYELAQVHSTAATTTGIASKLQTEKNLASLGKRVQAILQLATPDGYATEIGDTARKSSDLMHTLTKARAIIKSLSSSYTVSGDSTIATSLPSIRLDLASVLNLWHLNDGLIQASGTALLDLTPEISELNRSDTSAATNASELRSAGLFTLRGKDDSTKNVQLSFKAGRPGFKSSSSDGHGRYDQLSVDLTGYGRPLIQSPGTSSNQYVPGPARNWALTTTAQNAVSVDGYSHARTNGWFGYAKPVTRTDDAISSGTRQKGDLVTGWSYEYMNRDSAANNTGPIIARSIWFDRTEAAVSSGSAPSQTFIIVDFGQSENGTKHSFRSTFLLPTTQSPAPPWNAPGSAQILTDTLGNITGAYTSATGSGNVYVQALAPKWSEVGVQKVQLLSNASVTDPSSNKGASAAQLIIEQKAPISSVVTLIHTVSSTAASGGSAVKQHGDNLQAVITSQTQDHVTVALTFPDGSGTVTRSIRFNNPFSSGLAPLPSTTSNRPARPDPTTMSGVTTGSEYPAYLYKNGILRFTFPSKPLQTGDVVPYGSDQTPDSQVIEPLALTINEFTYTSKSEAMSDIVFSASKNDDLI